MSIDSQHAASRINATKRNFGHGRRRTRQWYQRLAISGLASLFSISAAAESLSGFITDLYGGAGIILPPAPGIDPNIANAHVPHFTGEQQIQQLNGLSNGIVAGTGVFSLNSTVAGITFDLTQGAPVVVEDSLGPLLAERANTSGKGRLAFAFGYSRTKFSELDGNDLSDTRVTLTHQDCCMVGPPPIPPPDGELTGFEQDSIELDIDLTLKQEVFALFANYGLADNWDIGLVVPIVAMEARAFSTAHIIVSNPGAGSTIGGNPVHSFDNSPSTQFSETGGKETGIGDVIVRTKYNFLNSQSDGIDLSALGQITLPTGDEDELLGTGETKFKAMLIASRTMGRLTPHLNLAWEQATSRAELENFSYAAGFDARITNRFTAGVDILGRYNPHIEEIGNHIVDIAIAAKFNPFNNANAPFNAFVIVPLNDDGLRADYVWGIGIDFILN